VQDRQPAGASNGTGGQWMPSPPKAKGKMPDLDLSDTPIAVRALLKANSSMGILERGFTIKCFQVNDVICISGEVVARSICPHCEGELDIEEAVKALDERTSVYTQCLECGRLVDTVSGRVSFVDTNDEKDIAKQIERVTQNLRQDVYESTTSGDERHLSVLEGKAEDDLEYWLQQMEWDPRDFWRLPIYILDNVTSIEDTVSVVISPSSPEIKILARRPPSEAYSYLETKTLECPLPLPVLQALEKELESGTMYSSLFGEERELLKERVSLSINWAVLRDRERHIWDEETND